MTRLKLTLILLCFMTMIQASNPFFEKYSTPHGTVPFNLIKTEHYAPALASKIEVRVSPKKSEETTASSV